MMPVSLRFTFEQFRKEVDSMSRISRQFMDPGADWVFGKLLTNLRQIQATGRPGRWDAPEKSPLTTLPSGEYEPGGKTAFHVRGEMTWTWALSPLHLRAKPKAVPDAFDVTGIASVSIRIRKATECDTDVLAAWNIELGAVDSPGCYFHAHIGNNLCVPRLPSLFVTPMAALEFLLGELFQDRWAEHVSKESGDVQFWRSTQRDTFVRLLDWKKKKVEAGAGSPWIALKKAKPEAADGLFVSVK